MNQEEIKALQKQNEELLKSNEVLKAEAEQAKAEAARIGDEAAKKMKQLRQDLSEGKTNLVEVDGVVTLSLRPSTGGKAKQVKYGIKPGHPKIRLAGHIIVTSESLMKLAQGQELSEDDLELNAGLKGWSKEDALGFLAENASIDAGWLVKK